MFNNEAVSMTRRYPDLPQKVLKRDSEIVRKLTTYWGVDNQDAEGVFRFFLKECRNLSHQRYWEILRTVWILSGSLERIQEFRKLFLSDRPHRYYFSTPEEAKKLRELNFPVRAYRATNDENDGGFSWTLSMEYAAQYKHMYSKSKIVAKSFERSEIFALIDRNKEEELLIIPKL